MLVVEKANSLNMSEVVKLPDINTQNCGHATTLQNDVFNKPILDMPNQGCVEATALAARQDHNYSANLLISKKPKSKPEQIETTANFEALSKQLNTPGVTQIPPQDQELFRPNESVLVLSFEDHFTFNQAPSSSLNTNFGSCDESAIISKFNSTPRKNFEKIRTPPPIIDLTTRMKEWSHTCISEDSEGESSGYDSKIYAASPDYTFSDSFQSRPSTGTASAVSFASSVCKRTADECFSSSNSSCASSSTSEENKLLRTYGIEKKNSASGTILFDSSNDDRIPVEAKGKRGKKLFLSKNQKPEHRFSVPVPPKPKPLPDSFFNGPRKLRENVNLRPKILPPLTQRNSGQEPRRKDSNHRPVAYARRAVKEDAFSWLSFINTPLEGQKK